MKGGIGSASITAGGVTVAALIAVNAVGDVRDPATGRLVAGSRSDDGLTLRDIQACFIAGRLPGERLAVADTANRVGDAPAQPNTSTQTPRPESTPNPMPHPIPGTNTTIGIVATDARLDKAQARRLAMQAHDGLARTLWPAHTAYDGDTLFALATGRNTATLPAEVLGTLAAEVTARAVLNALACAEALELPGFGNWPAAAGAAAAGAGSAAAD
jgi:L-aminopeptidase/D-esterase-like protein